MLKDRFAVLAVGTLLLLITVPYLLAFMTAPDGTQFVGSFHDPFDTPVYLSAMRAGARGELLRTLPFTSEPHAAALYYPFYMLLGHIAPPTIITYHVARVVMALLLSFAVGRLLSDVLVAQLEWRVAFVLSILGLGVGWLVVIGGFWTIVRPTDLFAPTSTLFGSAFINPHFPLAAALELLSFSAYLRARRHPYRDGTLLLGALSCFALGWVLPFSLVVVALVLLADVGVDSVRSRRLWTPSARAALFILALSGPTVVYYYSLAHGVQFWADLVAQWPPLDHTFTPPDYVAGYGLMLGLAIVGGVFAMSRRASTAAERFLVVWFVVNGLLVASPLDFSDRTSLAYGVPLAILS
ncbi:MAG: hypothetical protein E6J26_09675, partial [Chloroflexi bacterium]